MQCGLASSHLTRRILYECQYSATCEKAIEWPKPAGDTASFRLGVHVCCSFQGTEEKRVDSLTLGDVRNVSTLLNMNGVRLGERQGGSKKVAFCQTGFSVSLLGGRSMRAKQAWEPGLYAVKDVTRALQEE
jgi:hypothetical protein